MPAAFAKRLVCAVFRRFRSSRRHQPLIKAPGYGALQTLREIDCRSAIAPTGMRFWGSSRALGFGLAVAGSLFASPLKAASPDALFRDAADAYHAGDYSQAANTLSQAVAQHPASGSLQNLGNAEWQRGQPGAAILAWEQSLWLDPFNEPVRNNLRFARRAAQLEAPELVWYEVVSTWLPVNWWAWISGLSFWFSIGMAMLPGIFRLRKAAWHQAAAAFGLAVFLLSVPAQFGVATRSHLGFVLGKDTPLRLTPTQDGQIVTRLSPGEPGRVERSRRGWLLVRSSRATGWLEPDQFGQICPPSPAPRRS